MRKDLNLDIDLTLEPRYTKEFVVKKQDSINLCISLKNNNIPVPVEGQVPRLYVRKQDGSVVVQGGTEELGDGSIYLVGNTVIIKLKNSAVNATGLCYAELELEDESGITITQSFLFEVIDRLVDTDTPIKAVDDIYLLAEVEKFIIQAKKDLAEIRELINTLDNNVKEAVEYFNSKVVEVDTAINQRLNDAKAEIDTVKENTMSEIGSIKNETIETITNTKNETLEEINTKKEEIIDTMETLQGEVIIKVDEVSERHLKALETARDTHLEELEAKSLEEQEKIVAKGDEKVSEIISKGNEKVSEIEITANNKLNELREADETLNETIRISNIAGNNLEAIRQSAIEIKNQLDTSKEEGQTVANLLNNLMDNCEAMRKALQIENDEAVLNMEELRPLNGEADAKIVELRELIRQALEIAIPALKAYIAEHTPAEDLTEVNAQLEELYNAVRELDIRFNNYYTKEEVDKKFSDIKGLEVKGFIGESLQFPPVEANFANMVIPEEQLSNYPEIKHTFTYKQYYSSNTYFKRVFFFCDLNNTDDGKYLSFDGRYIQFHNITPDDYVMVQCYTSASNPTPNPNPYTLTALDCLDLNNIVHGFDFNLYNPEGTAIVENDPSKSGIGDFNKANEDGFYTLNTTASGFSTLVNAPAFTPSKDVKGILKVIGGNQTLDITSEGVVFEREQNGLWNNTLDKAMKKEAVGSITSDVKTITPAFFKSLPPDARYFFKNKQRLLFRSRENKYIAMRFATTAENCNITYNMGRNELYIQPKKETMQIDTYDAITGEWKTEIGRLSSAYGELTVLKDYFVVYENTMTIKYGGGTIYQEPTIAKFDGTPTINNFNNATEVGVYNVDIKADDTIENAPFTGAIAGILKVSQAGKTICQELIKDTNNVYIRTLINDGWTQWKESGATVDLSGYYNKQETDNKIDEKISAIQIPEIPEIPEVDLSNYYNKAEIDAKLVKEVGIIKSGDPNFKEPVWDELPTNTFINIPVNPDPNTYKWEMKCTHYGYHMVFYFPIDPTGKFGIVQRTDGKLGFKLLDNSFKYTTYKSYYKEKNSSKNWSNMPSDNHFLYPEKRELEAIYSHNFDIVDGNNPDVIFRYGSQNDFDAEPIKDFNDATELEVYTVNATESGIIENSPMTGTYKGVLDVVKANGFIEQTLKDINSDTSYFRRFDKTSWSEWRPNTIIEYGEHIIEAPATLEEDEEMDLLSITRGTIKDNDKYYARIAPTKRFTKVTGVTLASDLADLIIGFELNLNAVLINNSKDFMLFMKNNFKTDDSGYKGYEGLNMLMGRKIKYTIIGY